MKAGPQSFLLSLWRPGDLPKSLEELPSLPGLMQWLAFPWNWRKRESPTLSAPAPEASLRPEGGWAEGRPA